MDEPVTTASRFSQPSSEAPSTVFIITADNIKERGYKNLVDVLKDVPGFDIHEHIGGQAGGAYIIQRGIWGNNKILVLKDGIRLNPENGTHIIFGNQLSVDGLKQIEVMYGPSSAIYGADAFAGIINLITKDVSKKEQVEARISGGNANTIEGYLFAQGKAFENSYIQIYGHSYGSSGFDLRKKYKDYCYHQPQGKCTPFYNPNDSFNIPEHDYDILLKAGIAGFKLEGMYFHTKQPTNIAAPFNTGRTQDSSDRVESNNLNIELSNIFYINNQLNLLTKLGGQFYEIDPHSNYGRIDFNNYIYERSNTFRMEEKLQYNYSMGTALCGFVFKRISTMPYLNSRIPFNKGDWYDDFPIKEVRTWDGKLIKVDPLKEQNYWSYGFYLQFSHNLTEKLSIALGARYDWETFNHGTSFNPRLGLIYKFKKGETIKLMYGNAYISPSAYFRYKSWADNSYAHLPPGLFDEKLNSERIQSVEISYSRHTERLYGTFSLYFSQARDMIQEGGKLIKNNTFFYKDGRILGDATVEIPCNAGTQTNFGFDLFGSYRINSLLTLNLGYSFINARVRIDHHTYDAPKISSHKIMAGITGQFGRHLAYNIRCRWRSDIHTQPSNAVYMGNTIPGIFLLDSNIRWLDILPGLDAALTIKNILDTRYFTAGNGREEPVNGASLPRVPQNPIEFLIGMSYRY